LVLSLIFLVGAGLPQAVAQSTPRSSHGAQSGLNITQVTFSDDNPMEGEEITITATLTNNGSSTVDNVTVSFQVDQRDVIGNVSGITIGPDEARDASIRWVAEKWDHAIAAVVLVDGAPLMDVAQTAEIAVRAEPIGDIQSLFLALGIIMLTVVAAVMAPSIWSRIWKR